MRTMSKLLTDSRTNAPFSGANSTLSTVQDHECDAEKVKE